MPAWLISIIESAAQNLALPLVKQLLVTICTGLETKYPGIAPLMQDILNLVEGGTPASAVSVHLQSMPVTQPA